MATRRCKGRSLLIVDMSSVLVQVVVVVLLWSSYVAAVVPSPDDLKLLGESVDKELTSYLSTATNIDCIQRNYGDMLPEDKFEQLEGPAFVKEVAQNIGNILEGKIQALRKSVEVAEKLTETYVWNPDLTEVDALFGKGVNLSGEYFVEDKLYGQSVNRYNSTVHVPIDIYDKDVTILNTLAWTKNLDEIWRKTKEQDEGLTWQYFGSQTGVMRIYPGAEFIVSGEVDLYDVRRRPWFTQGASSPKEMLILIDTSGSCYGQALALMKHSIRSLIETLAENDFVNVANFSADAGWVGCFKTLVQATTRNKQKLLGYVDTLQANGVADYHKGFEFAFQQFQLYSESNSSHIHAGCNKIIMFLTDGGTEKPEELFEQYNPNKTIRIFSYAVGPIASPTAAVKWIGCVSRGKFYEIPAMGAIRSTVQEYVNIVSLGVLPHVGLPVTWSRPYADSYRLGLVTTVTMPVFNRSMAVANQTILGVMGVDLLVSELIHAVPLRELGPTGYGFILNMNGIVVSHPYLRNDDPSPQSLDYVEIEDETPDKMKVRMDMIDQVPGQESFDSFVIRMDDHHTLLKKRNYYYEPIPNSNYSMGIVLPEHLEHHVDTMTDQSPTEADIEALENSQTATIVKYKTYCKDIKPVSNVSSPVEDFFAALQYNYSTCDDVKVRRLMLDVEATKNCPMSSSDGVVSSFVAMQHGFVHVDTTDDASFFEEHVNSWQQPYFLRTWDTNNWTLTVDDQRFWQNESVAVVTATKAVSKTLSSTDHPFNLAVAGVRLTQEPLHEIISAKAAQCSDENTDCYLVDDGAIVVYRTPTSTDDQDIGKFLGTVEPAVMADLLNKSIYLYQQFYDYQGTCYKSNNDLTSDGQRLLPWMFYDLLSLNWWTTSSTWAYVNFLNFYSWMFSAPAAVEGNSANMDQQGYDCIRVLHKYYFGEETEYSGLISCPEDCSRSYAVTRLKSSNLLLVLVDSAGGDSCSRNCGDFTSLPFEPVETEDPFFSGEHCQAEPRYRRRPPCYQDNPSESESHCAASCPSAPVRLMFMFTLTATLLTACYRRLTS